MRDLVAEHYKPITQSTHQFSCSISSHRVCGNYYYYLPLDIEAHHDMDMVGNLPNAKDTCEDHRVMQRSISDPWRTYLLGYTIRFDASLKRFCYHWDNKYNWLEQCAHFNDTSKRKSDLFPFYLRIIENEPLWTFYGLMGGVWRLQKFEFTPFEFMPLHWVLDNLWGWKALPQRKWGFWPCTTALCTSHCSRFVRCPTTNVLHFFVRQPKLWKSKKCHRELYLFSASHLRPKLNGCAGGENNEP